MRHKLTTAAIGAFSLAAISPLRATDLLYSQAVDGQSAFGPSEASTPSNIKSGVADDFSVINNVLSGVAAHGGNLKVRPPAACLASSAERRVEGLRASYNALPLSFEINQGQTNSAVKFLTRASGYLLFLTSSEAVMSLDNPRGKEGKLDGLTRTNDESTSPRSIVRIKLEGANAEASIEGLDELAGKSNYFGGPDPAKWRTDIPSYARVRYSEVYPGIDLVYYGNQRQLEYDFIIAPGADPDVVQIAFIGVDGSEISSKGDFLLHTTAGDLRQLKPVAYQYVYGARHDVCANYLAKGESGIGFELGEYDRSRPLIIDPVLVYSTYLGGNGFDQGYAIAVDSLGSAYVTGKTATVDFPTTAGAFQTSYAGGDAAFIAKLNPEGTALVYSTYLNGASGNGIAVDSAGNAYVTGEASTPDFPITPGAFQTEPFGFDTFITKLNATGSALVYSSRFGGNFDDFGRDIALDAAGNAYITGWTVCRAPTCTFPTVNAFQPNYGGGNNDAFVSKMNSSGSALVYSTYLGGGDVLNATDDWGEGIAVDSAGSAYVTGYTYSPDFPVTPGAYDTVRAGLDAFITKFAPDGKSLVYSTFLGGASQDLGIGIAVDASGSAYVTGITDGSGFPVTPGAFQTTGSFDAFVTKFNPQGSALVYSTYLGGSAGVDRGWAIAIDSAGNAYVAGDTTSSNFPTANPIQAQYGNGLSDAFVSELNAAGSALVYSTFLGGSAFDEGRGIALNGSGDAFATGDTSSDNFPTANALQPNNGGGLEQHDDAFVVKLGNTNSPPPITPTSVVSRKTHKRAGTFDINLPLTGNVGVECRSGGTSGTYQIVSTFSKAVTVGSATATPGAGGSGSVLGAPIVSPDGKTVTVNLTGVSNVQTIVVTLSNVSDGTGTNNVTLPMGVLIGDITADRVVNTRDISQVKGLVGQAVTISNFRSDVTADGVIKNPDVSVVKSEKGTILP